jgi:D-alanyl-D-alanine dipeptidase
MADLLAKRGTSDVQTKFLVSRQHGVAVTINTTLTMNTDYSMLELGSESDDMSRRKTGAIILAMESLARARERR